MTIPPNTKPTEPSSLFSLSSLESLAASELLDKSGPKPAEGSGVLDIHALAAATQQRRAAEGRVDAESVAPTVPLLLTPNLPRAYEEPVGWSRGTKAIVAAMGVSILALGGAVGYLVTRTSGAEPSAAPLVASAPAAATPAQDAPAAPLPGAAASPGVTAPDAPKPAADAPSAAVAPAPSAARDDKSASRSTRTRDGNSKVESTPAVAAAAPAKAPAAETNASIDSLLDQALGPKAAKPRAQAPAAAASATPSRDDVLAEMKKVGARIKACGGSPGSMALAKVTVAGSTGRVTGVDVENLTDAKVRACIVHEVSRAKFAPFTAASFNVTYPFRL